jgi:oligopeptide transport system ATP-binding protein
MRQRVMIAMGLLCEPSLLIADEPTTALDVTVQAQITQLVGELRQKSNMSLILITHDLAVVAAVCDQVLVMYAGQVVETGSVEDIFYRPQHPYTQGLLASVPRMDRPVDDELHSIPGNPPNLMDLGSGCHFRERCSKAMDVCKDDPPLQVAQDGRVSRCFIDIANGEGVNIEVVGSETAAEENTTENSE